MSLKRFTVLLSTIALCHMAGVIGAFYTAPNISSWYDLLVQPSFTPPSWLFGPVWLTLYTLMGIALYFIVTSRQSGKSIRRALLFFYAQLVLNAAWSILFFGLQSPLLGFLCIIVLLFLILIMIVHTYRVHKQASALLLPYVVWVAFATVLNGAILFLN